MLTWLSHEGNSVIPSHQPQQMPGLPLRWGYNQNRIHIFWGATLVFYFWYKGIEGRKWTVLWLTGEWEYVAWLVSATFVLLPFPAGPGWFERRSVGWRLRRIIPTYGGKSIKFPWVYPRVYPNCSMFPTYSQWYCRKLFHYITIMKPLIP
jgi:hypothetical protein